MTKEATIVRDRIRSLRRVRAGDLIPHPKNWRRHPAGQAAAMRAALTEIGFADALLVRETKKGLQIIDGHLRADLCPDQKVPCLVLDVTAKEADKLLATFDPITAMAETDIERLSALAGTLDFDVPELGDLVAATLGDTGSGDITEDDPPAPQDGPCVAQVGDVWACGRHRVVCGDATDEATVAALLDGARPFIMVTDPPYGIDAPNMTLGTGKKDFAARGDWDKVRPEVAEHVALVEYAIVWGGNYFAHDLPVTRGWLCWHKKNDGLSFSECELAWTNLRINCYHLSHHWSGEVKNHPTQKPLAVIAWCLSLADDGDVYDPFLGSGTTLIAAEQLDRTCYGIEIEPKYVDVILQRYMNFTDVSPVRESDGALFSELVKAEAVPA